MCNDYEQNVSWAQYRAAMRAADLTIANRQSGLDLPPAADIWIGNTGPVARPARDVVELAPMRFGMPPANPRAGPIFNFRSEGRHFATSHRCLVIASGFYEFTGTSYPKTKHRFTLNDAPCMAIAGIWRPGDGNQPDAFAMLTTAPGPDVAPFLSRQLSRGGDALFETLSTLALRVNSRAAVPILWHLLKRWAGQFDLRSQMPQGENIEL